LCGYNSIATSELATDDGAIKIFQCKVQPAIGLQLINPLERSD